MVKIIKYRIIRIYQQPALTQMNNSLKRYIRKNKRYLFNEYFSKNRADDSTENMWDNIHAYKQKKIHVHQTEIGKQVWEILLRPKYLKNAHTIFNWRKEA